MRHLKSREDFEPKDDELSEFAPLGAKRCEARCDKSVVMTSKGPVIVCNACKRVVMDKRRS